MPKDPFFDWEKLGSVNEMMLTPEKKLQTVATKFRPTLGPLGNNLTVCGKGSLLNLEFFPILVNNVVFSMLCKSALL